VLVQRPSGSPLEGSYANYCPGARSDLACYVMTTNLSHGATLRSRLRAAMRWLSFVAMPAAPIASQPTAARSKSTSGRHGYSNDAELDDLMASIVGGDVADVRRRLTVRRIDLNRHTKWNSTPLDHAIAASRRDGGVVLRLLVSAGADVNFADAHFGRTPLMYALAAADADAIQFLIDAGADRSQCDCNGESALTLAAAEGVDPQVRRMVCDVRTERADNHGGRCMRRSCEVAVAGRSLSQPGSGRSGESLARCHGG